jgi:pimeloyl-ACP methyl ester carboxylesterase
MDSTIKKNLYFLIALVVIIAFSAVMADLIESSFGKVDVSVVEIEDPDGNIVVAKLFVPEIATASSPMPAVVNMHGYQNDKNVQDPFSIELARRGFVVLAPDALGHGDSLGGLNLMGWFADPAYVMGNETALAWLIEQPYVDAEYIGVTGHSMGGMNAVKLPGLFPENVKAVVQQASSPGSPELPNLLMLQARYDEFLGFRENQLRVENLNESETRLAALGLEGPVEWDTTYGSFEDGTARRMALIQMDHHLLPLQNKSVAEEIEWFRLALLDGEETSMWIEPTKQVFMIKEIFGFITLLGTMVTMLPITSLLLQTKFFAPVAQPVPTRYVPDKRSWWTLAIINLLIAMVLYPLTTQYGGILGPIEGWFKGDNPLGPFKMEMANGVAWFFIINAVVAFLLFLNWYSQKKKEGVTMYDMGVTYHEDKGVVDWGILGKTVLVGVILFAWMYIFEGIFQWTIGQEFRFAWPYMRQFSSGLRVGYFFIYLIPALLFFLINGGIFLFGQIHQKEYETENKTQWMWWLKTAFTMVGGLFIVWCFQYLPWFLPKLFWWINDGVGGPGFEIITFFLMDLSQFTSMWPLMLFVYVPEFLILFWFLIWFYRKTGKIYLGAMMISILVTWFLTAGSIYLM